MLLRVTFLNKCDEIEKKIISEYYQRCFGEETARVFNKRTDLKCKKRRNTENFKTAIKSTVKSISNKDDIEISFGGQEISNENNKLKLPEINEFQNKISFNLTRAFPLLSFLSQADSESLLG